MGLTDFGLQLLIAIAAAAFGILWAPRLANHKPAVAWVVLVLGILAGSGVLSHLIVMGPYHTELERALWGLGFGILFGFVIRRGRSS